MACPACAAQTVSGRVASQAADPVQQLPGGSENQEPPAACFVVHLLPTFGWTWMLVRVAVAWKSCGCHPPTRLEQNCCRTFSIMVVMRARVILQDLIGVSEHSFFLTVRIMILGWNSENHLISHERSAIGLPLYVPSGP
jgi:hypothetical protein